jgi:hypothetical protein
MYYKKGMDEIEVLRKTSSASTWIDSSITGETATSGHQNEIDPPFVDT